MDNLVLLYPFFFVSLCILEIQEKFREFENDKPEARKS